MLGDVARPPHTRRPAYNQVQRVVTGVLLGLFTLGRLDYAVQVEENSARTLKKSESSNAYANRDPWSMLPLECT
jgi:hypothetical protein